jgi:hypothetical protein
LSLAAAGHDAHLMPGRSEEARLLLEYALDAADHGRRRIVEEGNIRHGQNRPIRLAGVALSQTRALVRCELALESDSGWAGIVAH